MKSFFKKKNKMDEKSEFLGLHVPNPGPGYKGMVKVFVSNA